MAYWRKGKGRTKSLKTKTRGTTTRRKIGVRNYTDKGYKKVHKKKPSWRKKNRRNTTDGARRVSSNFRL